jgi:hypothetical protein
VNTSIPIYILSNTAHGIAVLTPFKREKVLPWRKKRGKAQKNYPGTVNK